MKGNKQIIKAVILTAFCLILGSCFSGWMPETSGTGTITISFNSSGAPAASRSVFPPWPPQTHGLLGKLDYVITLSSAAGSIPTFTAKSGDTISRVVNAGYWTVKIDAYLQGAQTEFSPGGERIHYASGTLGIQVIEGRDNHAPVQMFPICQECMKRPCSCSSVFNVPKSLSAGYNYTVVINADGSLWVWGRNNESQHGDGGYIDKDVPTRIGTDTNWASVSAGANHNLAIKEDGSLWAWGQNGGKLGNGSTIARATPVRIGTETDWSFVIAGGNHSVAIKTDGSLWAWGHNSSGYLGDGTTVNKNIPTRIGTETDWAYVSAGGSHTVALKTDGSLWSWGFDYLGDQSKVVPTPVDTAKDWAYVSAGNGYTTAIKTDGSLWAWGYNEDGYIGDGTIGNKRVPTRIGTETDWSSVFAGVHHTLAIKKDGSLWAWGWNGNGQLGDGTTTDRFIPTRIGNDINWSSVSAGNMHTVALKTNGSLWTWGINQYGQLGDSTNTDRHNPVQIGGSIFGLVVNWATVSAGFTYTVAIRKDGSLWAWGQNASGQLGDGTTRPKSFPSRIGNETNWLSVSAAYGGDTPTGHTVAIKTDGSLWAWGRNDGGQLGDGTNTNRNSPVRIGNDSDWVSVSAGSGYTVAKKEDGSLWAWGRYDINVPAQLGTETNWSSVSAGRGYNIAIKTDGSRWAWGTNSEGQLGDGTNLNFTYKQSPFQIGTETDWSSVSAGSFHTMAIKEDGSLWAWGRNREGQLGDGTTDSKYVPTRIGQETDWSSVSAGEAHTIAVKKDGSLWVWGLNGNGQLGDGTTDSKYVPTRIDTTTDWSFVGKFWSGTVTVAIKKDGSLWVWGRNNEGQLGDGTTTDRLVPVRIH